MKAFLPQEQKSEAGYIKLPKMPGLANRDGGLSLTDFWYFVVIIPSDFSAIIPGDLSI